MEQVQDGNGYGGAESIYRIARKIKRREQSLYNALRSIYEDAGFVMEVQGLRPELPLLANLRCGLWYAPKFDDVCYFKSTDGHTGNWSFNPTRLNMHVALIAAQKGGCMIVDATRKGKRFPDSMSKTIPIWTCVVNRGVAQVRGFDCKSNDELEVKDGISSDSPRWDCSLHLPNWVSDTEKSRIESRMDGWVKILLATGTDLSFLATCLRKPLRPLWISQKSLIWLNEVPDSMSLAFTPVILISASKPLAAPQRMSDSEFGWDYIPGSADDEESWARSLTPNVFWKHALDIISGSPDECNRKVAEIRVHRSLRGESTPQARVKMVDSATHNVCSDHPTTWNSEGTPRFHWIGNTGLAIGSAHSAEESLKAMDSVIDCNGMLHNVYDRDKDCYLNLQIEGSKFDRYSLQSHLFAATEFARRKLQKGNKVLVCCKDGEDISVSVCLAILLSCFNQDGVFDNGKTFQSAEISKWDVRQRLVYLCGYVSNARPARGSLRQVYNFSIAKTVSEKVRESSSGS